MKIRHRQAEINIGMVVLDSNLMFLIDRFMFGETNSPPSATDKKLDIPVDINSMFVCSRLSPVMLDDILVQKQASQAIIIAITNA